MMQDVRVKLNPGLPWQNSTQQEETSAALHLQRGSLEY